MKVTDRQKVCSNCDGRIALEATECPYCGTEFSQEEKKSPLQAPLFKNQTLQESLASLYTPPYSQSKSEYKTVLPTPAPFKEPLPPETPLEKEPSQEQKETFWTLFALIVAGNLLTIGLLQFFFSEEGVLRLEWDSSYWFLYCLIALPLFYLGLKRAETPK
jgi:hypothetical protein